MPLEIICKKTLMITGEDTISSEIFSKLSQPEKDEITRIISNDAKKVGEEAFSCFNNLKEIILSDKVELQKDEMGIIRTYEVLKTNLKIQEYLNNRGCFKMNVENNYQDALENFDVVIKIDNDNDTYYRNRGLAKGKLADRKKEIKDYEGAINDYTEAVKDYESAISKIGKVPIYCMKYVDFNYASYSNHLKKLKAKLEYKIDDQNPKKEEYYNKLEELKVKLEDLEKEVQKHDVSITETATEIFYNYRNDIGYIGDIINLKYLKKYILDINQELSTIDQGFTLLFKGAFANYIYKEETLKKIITNTEEAMEFAKVINLLDLIYNDKHWRTFDKFLKDLKQPKNPVLNEPAKSIENQGGVNPQESTKIVKIVKKAKLKMDLGDY